jgi:hypothetical protein
MSTLLSASEAIKLNTGKPKVLSELGKLTNWRTGELGNWGTGIKSGLLLLIF